MNKNILHISITGGYTHLIFKGNFFYISFIQISRYSISNVSHIMHVHMQILVTRVSNSQMSVTTPFSSLKFLFFLKENSFRNVHLT